MERTRALARGRQVLATSLEKTHVCSTCQRAVDGTDHMPPTHVVNPTTGQRTKFDAKSEAVCPMCGATWWRYEGFTMLVTGDDRRAWNRRSLSQIKKESPR